MAAPRAKTLIERFGFNDPELTTPMHDEMFIVCMGRVQKIIDLVIKSDHRFDSWRRMKQELNDLKLVYNVAECSLSAKDAFELLRELEYIPIRTVPEKPIVAKNDFIIGFIDMFMSVSLNPRISVSLMQSLFEYTGFGHSRYTEDERYKLCGIYDHYMNTINDLLPKFNIFIEIKPSIRSVGELIRQIQTYRQFAKGTTVFVVISKPTAFKDVLAQSDILLIDYKDVLPDEDMHQRELAGGD